MVTTVDIPEELAERLRKWAEQRGKSVDELILSAIRQSLPYGGGGKRVTEPMIKGGTRGPLYPTDETPYDLILP